ncbi:hypothetical protein MAR621_03152 [Maribacter dokdonensis]|uniref:hypothetical protein n=1 Tax=Maribacter dokdonensis TaxID=320912 RepID=UPI001B263E67|nr:hypothetical protein [Maribacter dokdonensis]CAG2532958.1 hypothetical protein MAR621_03152 [Maribacter dokdonensis]
MRILYLIPFLLFVFIVWSICVHAKRPYTDEEWEEQCKQDFKKYGPVPEDEETNSLTN